MILHAKASIDNILPKDTFLIKSSQKGLKPNTYVDKTAIISRLIADRGAYCLCRPRRFGKSLTASIIADIFAQGLANFQDCAIAKDNLWHDKKYPVLFLSFNNIALNNQEALINSLKNNLQHFARTHQIDLDILNFSLQDAIFNLLNHHLLEELVIIIDEYDLPLISILERPDTYSEIVEVLASFYSALKSFESKIRFMFLTGVNRVSHLSIFSGFNNIQDISFDPKYAAIVGYTEQELINNFLDPLKQIANYYDLSFDDFMQHLKAKYNGYCFTFDLQTSVFNTWDINNLLTSTISSFSEEDFLPSYWAYTGSLSNFVIQYFAYNKQKLVNFIEQATTILPVITKKDLLTPKSFRDTSELIFMLNAGYLTLAKASKEDTLLSGYQLSFPNNAVMNFVLDDLISSINSFLGDKGLDLINRHKDVLTLLDVSVSCTEHKEILSTIIVSSGVLPKDTFISEGQLRTLLIIMFKVANLQVHFEVSKIGGRVDLLVVYKNTAYIFELKVFDSSKIKQGTASLQDIELFSYKKKLEAFSQIANKEYYYLVPRECKQCYFGAVVGDCATRKITDFEYLTQAQLIEQFQHSSD